MYLIIFMLQILPQILMLQVVRNIRTESGTTGLLETFLVKMLARVKHFLSMLVLDRHLTLVILIKKLQCKLCFNIDFFIVRSSPLCILSL